MNFDELINPGVKGAPLVLPLKAFYGRDPRAQRGRKRSLHLCHWHFRERGEIVLPLAAYYGRSPEFEDSRRQFYSIMARVHGFENWRLSAPAIAKLPPAGREGRERQILPPDRETLATRDLSQSVLAWILATDHMNDPVKRSAPDWAKNDALLAGQLRRKTAATLRDLHDTATGSPLKSVDWMREASGQFGPRSLSVSRYEAMMRLGEIRAAIPASCMNLIGRDLFHDEFSFALPSRQARAIAIEDLRFALDFAAHAIDKHEMPQDRLVSRWKQAGDYLILLPAVEAARRTRTVD